MHKIVQASYLFLFCSFFYSILFCTVGVVLSPLFSNTTSGQRRPSKPLLSISDPMDAGEGNHQRAHVVVFPFPAQGHLTSMLNLANILSLAGLHVTFLNTDYNHRRVSLFSGAYARLAGRPGFRFRSIPDGLPDDEPRSASRLWTLEESMRTRGRASFHDLLVRYRGCDDDDDDGWPKVTCVICDGVMPFGVEVAEGLGIPGFAFRTISGACIWAYLSIPSLLRNGELPLSADDADLDIPIQGVQGMEGFLRRRDLPSFCRHAKDARDPILHLMATVTATANQARGLILNTMEFLEAPILDHIRSHSPLTYTVGPLQSLLRAMSNEDSPTAASIWQEDHTCLTWLDSHPHHSVIYVSFGSFTVVSSSELLEFWHGLVNSGYPFLWVMRPGLEGKVDDDDEEILSIPAELAGPTRERGCLVRWAPQQEVLAHKAVGCFLTHSGWNSTLESITIGMPMICWPFFADQQINSRFVSEVWQVGLDMKDQCGRALVERMVREVMEGETAQNLRQSSAKMAEMARRSVEEGGSSKKDLMKLVQHIVSLSSEIAN